MESTNDNKNCQGNSELSIKPTLRVTHITNPRHPHYGLHLVFSKKQKERKYHMREVNNAYFYEMPQNGVDHQHARRGKHYQRVNSSEADLLINCNDSKITRNLYEEFRDATSNGGELFYPEKDEKSERREMLHGKTYEDLVLFIYRCITETDGMKGGYWKMKKWCRYAGSSPDWIVLSFEEKVEHIDLSTERKMVGIVEAKVRCFGPILEIPVKHIIQMQHQMMVTGFKWCDYISVYIDIENPLEAAPLVYLARVYRCDKFINSLLFPAAITFAKALEGPRITNKDEINKMFRPYTSEKDMRKMLIEQMGLQIEFKLSGVIKKNETDPFLVKEILEIMNRADNDPIQE